jgi:hypothetical protein
MNASTAPPVSIEALEDASVDPETFNHESHVYVAWLYLEQWPLSEATQRFCAAIRNLTRKLGAETKYHETITCFFMQLINQRRATMQQTSWAAFRDKNTDLVAHAGTTLNRHYSKDLLASEIARQQYLLPDKLHISDS